jgi:hypothetical protein
MRQVAYKPARVGNRVASTSTAATPSHPHSTSDGKHHGAQQSAAAAEIAAGNANRFAMPANQNLMGGNAPGLLLMFTVTVWLAPTLTDCVIEPTAPVELGTDMSAASTVYVPTWTEKVVEPVAVSTRPPAAVKLVTAVAELLSELKIAAFVPSGVTPI